MFVGEWWKSDTEAIINEALKSGLAPNVSDSHTINGLPGKVANCSTQGIFCISKAEFGTLALQHSHISYSAHQSLALMYLIYIVQIYRSFNKFKK